MREMAPGQSILASPSPSVPSTSSESDKQTTLVHTPCGRKVVSRKTKKMGKVSKKVDFSSPPKWKTKHSAGGSKVARVGNGQRDALKPIQENLSTPKLLVGCKSPRIPTVGKGKENSKLKQLTFEYTSPRSDKINTIGANIRTPEGEVPLCDASVVHQETQTETDMTSSLDYRMCTEEEPPAEYWKNLAEQRRLALAETLQENEELHSELKTWKSRVEELDSKATDLEYFAMLYKLASTEDP